MFGKEMLKCRIIAPWVQALSAAIILVTQGLFLPWRMTRHDRQTGMLVALTTIPLTMA
jgi:hypothetical protein